MQPSPILLGRGRLSSGNAEDKCFHTSPNNADIQVCSSAQHAQCCVVPTFTRWRSCITSARACTGVCRAAASDTLALSEDNVESVLDEVRRSLLLL